MPDWAEENVEQLKLFYSHEEYTEALEQAWREGKAEGEEIGWRDGYLTGLGEGYDNGKEAGYHEGYTIAWNAYNDDI